MPSRRRIGFRTDESSSKLYSTGKHEHENTKTTHETPEMREIKQRLKMYKKRLGSHQQKALAQEKKHGKIKQRTKDAIENNRNWVTHYTNLLNQPK